MSMFNRLKISTKVYGGFGVILVLLVIASIWSELSVSSVGDDFVRYRHIALQSNQAGRVQANLLEARVSVKQFLLTGESAAAKNVDDRLASAITLNDELVELLDTDEMIEVAQVAGESLKAYRAGDRDGARKLALAAYLDGFEPVEPVLGARDATLMTHIERDMGEYRAAIDQGDPVEAVATKAAVLGTLFDDADRALSPDATSGTTTFIGAFTVLLREGLEALLIVVAMLAFLDKAERRDALRYVHGGWAGALIAGGATWVVATYMIGISGASRELTEGFGSILAAVVLLSVGIWMHGKAQAGQWQRYIREKLSKALDRKSGWFLFGLAFVVVYREVFETILFYAALWAQGSGAAMLAGAGTAVLLLGAIAWAMLRYSRQLPIATFFRYSSWLMAALTVVLAGKGIAALQEAGIIDIAPVADAPRLSMIGLFPTIQSMAAQLFMLLIVFAGFAFNRRIRLSER